MIRKLTRKEIEDDFDGFAPFCEAEDLENPDSSLCPNESVYVATRKFDTEPYYLCSYHKED